MPTQTKLSPASQPQSSKSKLGPQSASAQASAPAAKLSGNAIADMRKLAHDLSNSIETVMQACYLLNQGKLDPAHQRWVSLIDQAVRDAARINREIRDLLRAQSGEPPSPK